VPDRLGVTQVAGDDLASLLDQAGALLGIANQAADVVAASTELANDLSSDESGASGDEYPHPASLSRPGRYLQSG
jgi:hypothetical protein